MSNMPSSDVNQPSTDGYREFETLAVSAMRRLYELRASDAALFRLISTYTNFRLNEAEGKLLEGGGWEDVRLGFRKIDPENIEILDREYTNNTVVAALTMFDTFLSDLTRFLFLLRPQALPKDRQVKVGDIINSESLPEVLDMVVGKYVYELSYGRLSDRLKQLEAKFGITCLTSGEALEKLEKYTEIRNLIVHDATSFRYQASSKFGYIRVSRRGDRPKVTWEEAESIVDTCVQAVDEIFASTSRKMFGREAAIRVGKSRGNHSAA